MRTLASHAVLLALLGTSSVVAPCGASSSTRLAGRRRGVPGPVVLAASPLEKKGAPSGLADALSDILAGGTADTDIEAESVWPAEEAEPASGFDSSSRRRRAITTPEPQVIVREVTVKVTVTVTVPPQKKTVTVEGDCPCEALGDLMDSVKCSPADCSAAMAKQAEASAAASTAANTAAQAAMAAAAALPSQAALASQELVKQAMQAAAASRDYAQRAYATAAASKAAVEDLRSDLWRAATARAAELDRVRVTPPSFPVV